MDFSKDQLKALNILLTGNNCFVHGDAGTGKSTVIEHFSLVSSQNGKKVGKCSFTGLATMNLLKRNDNETVATINTLFEFRNPSLKIKRKTANHISNFDIIIIDEISTCTALYFTCVAECIKFANQIRNGKGKNNIQIVVCGDFYQLSPFYDYEKWIKTYAGEWEKIVDEEAKNSIIKIVGADSKGDPNLYSFECKCWNEFDFQYILLTENHRQAHDLEYSNQLKKMRESIDQKKLAEICDYFNSNCYKEIPANLKLINLFWKNDDVENKNIEELRKLQGITRNYRAKITGELIFLMNKEKWKSLPIIPELSIKNGAQVIFTSNDIKNEPRRYANGDLATVIDCDEDTVLLKLVRNGELVRLYFDECGLSLYKPPKYVENIDGKIDIIQEKYDGEIYQFPIKLAYALTIYKAQGQTFDNVNVCYNGKGENILYVALSRARTIKNLFLSNKIYPWQITHSKKVEMFYNQIKNKIYKE